MLCLLGTCYCIHQMLLTLRITPKKKRELFPFSIMAMILAYHTLKFRYTGKKFKIIFGVQMQLSFQVKGFWFDPLQST